MPDNKTPYTATRDINSPTEPRPSSPSTPPDQQTYKMIMTLFDQAKTARKAHDQDWDTYMEFYKGRQWTSRKRPSYRASPNVNVIRSTVQTVLPIMTDREPSIDVTPQQPADYDFANTVNELVDRWWNDTTMNMVLSDAVFDALIYKCGILKCCWDPDARQGLGEIEVKRVDPRNLYIQSGAIDVNSENGYVLEEVYMPLGEARMKFPEYADKLQGTSGQSEADKHLQSKTYTGQITVQSPTDRDTGISDKATSGAGGSSGRMVRLIEAWLDDDTLIEYEYEEDGEKKTGKKKKYPRGRLITIAPDQRLTLQDVDIPYADGKKPYVRIVDTSIAGEFYGEGEVEPLMDTQKQLNKATATIIDWMNMVSNNIWILDDDSGVRPQDITNQVGLILTKKRGTEVRREQAPAMPDQIFKFYEVLMQLVDQQSGIHDVTQGRKPTGITAAEAISEMQDAAQTRIRLKERNLNSSLTQLGYMVVSRMLQYYTEPRVVKVAQEGVQWPKFYEVYVEQVDEDNYTLNKREYEFDEAQRQYIMVSDWEGMGPSEGVFDVEVHAGTALPLMKAQQSTLAFRLFEAGVIDEQALLQAVDWPNWEETLRRKQEAMAAMPPEGAPAPGAAPAPPSNVPARTMV